MLVSSEESLKQPVCLEPQMSQRAVYGRSSNMKGGDFSLASSLGLSREGMSHAEMPWLQVQAGFC